MRFTSFTQDCRKSSKETYKTSSTRYERRGPCFFLVLFSLGGSLATFAICGCFGSLKERKNVMVLPHSLLALSDEKLDSKRHGNLHLDFSFQLRFLLTTKEHKK